MIAEAPTAVPPVQTQTMVVDFRADGGVEAMHRDSFDLGFLGKQQITRASDIRFDEVDQSWSIFVADGSGFKEVQQAKGFSTYEDGRRMEVRWFEVSRLHGLAPMSAEGIELLNVLRAKFD